MTKVPSHPVDWCEVCMEKGNAVVAEYILRGKKLCDWHHYAWGGGGRLIQEDDPEG